MKTLGFIGTGTIAKHFIEGLRASGCSNPIVVSPRSDDIGNELIAKFESVDRAESNSDVAKRSSIVFLSMRPAQVEEALAGVQFRPEQIICSFVTGLMVNDIALLAPRSAVCRVLPLPTVTARKGPIIHFPQIPEIVDLIREMGDLILPNTEAELVALGGASGFMSTFFELQDSLANWLKERNVQPDVAGLYVRSLFSGLSETALGTSETLSSLADRHETKGGLNERTRLGLIERAWFTNVADTLTTVQQIKRMGLS